MITVHVDRMDVAMGDTGPLFRAWQFDDDAVLQDVVERSTRGYLAHVVTGIIWQLTGGGIREVGSPRFAPGMSGPGKIDFVQVIRLPVAGSREEEERVVEIVPGCLTTPILELPIVEPDGIARLWWWEPHQSRW